jgi:hypothetical protein
MGCRRSSGCGGDLYRQARDVSNSETSWHRTELARLVECIEQGMGHSVQGNVCQQWPVVAILANLFSLGRLRRVPRCRLAALALSPVLAIRFGRVAVEGHVPFAVKSARAATPG